MSRYRFIFRFHAAAVARTPQEARMEVLETIVKAGIGDPTTHLDLVYFEPVKEEEEMASDRPASRAQIVLSPEFDEE